jgi:pre-mRNA-splicing factor SYF1
MHYYTNLLLSPSFLDSSEAASAIASTSAPTPTRPLEAAKLLLILAIRAREGSYVSPEAKSGYQLLMEFMAVCERFAEDVGIDLEESEKAEAARKAAAVAVDANADEADVEDEGSKGKAVQLLRLGALTTNGSTPAKSTNPVAAKVANVSYHDIDPLSAAPLDVSYLLHVHGLTHYPDQSGPLYTSLATYWIKRAEFPHARSVFEGAYQTVVTLRDFSVVFDAGVEFEESVISSLMDSLAEEADEDEDEAEVEEERKGTESELDERMKYFEELMDRRPFLVNEVLLRRNPNDVQEWEKRVVLYGADVEKVRTILLICHRSTVNLAYRTLQVVETYTKALSVIAPRKATVGLHSLWIHFAKYYETAGELDSARKVFERATQVPFRKVEELAEIWCEFAEMEVRNE